MYNVHVREKQQELACRIFTLFDQASPRVEAKTLRVVQLLSFESFYDFGQAFNGHGCGKKDGNLKKKEMSVDGIIAISPVSFPDLQSV